MRIKNHILASVCLLFALTYSLSAQEKKQAYIIHAITTIDSLGNNLYKAQIAAGQDWGILPDKQAKVYGKYDEEQPKRNVEIGVATVKAVEETQSQLQIQLHNGQQLLASDLVYLPSEYTPAPKGNTDLFKLVQLRLSLLDTANQELFSLKEVWNNDTHERQREVEQQILALLKARAELLKSSLEGVEIPNGYFKGQNLYNAIQQLTLTDVRSFLRYIVLASPMQYMGMQKSASREFVLWAMGTNYNSAADLLEIYQENPREKWAELDKRYQHQIEKDKIEAWLKTAEANGENTEQILKLALYHYHRMGNIDGELNTTASLSTLFAEKGDLEKAHKQLKNALDIAQQQEASPITTLNIYLKQAEVYQKQNDSIKTQQSFQAGMDFSTTHLQELGTNEEGYKAYMAFVDTYAADAESKSNWNTYISLRKQQAQALRGWGITDNLLANVLWNVGYGYTQLEQDREALNYYFKALPQYDTIQSNNDRYAVGRFRQFIADRYWSLEQYDSAYFHIERGIATLEDMNRAFPNQGAIFNELGSSYDKWGDKLYTAKKYEASLPAYQKALDYYQLLVAQITELDNQRAVGSVMNDLSDAYQKLERYEEAVEWQTKRVQWHLSVNDSSRWGDAYWDLGLIYDNNLQQYPKAIEAYTHALAYYETAEKSEKVSVLYRNIANDQKKLALYKEAMVHIQKSIQTLEGQEESSEEIKSILAKNYDVMADIYGKKSDYATEQQILLKEMEIWQSLNKQEEIADSYWDLGVSKVNQRQYREANSLYQQALKVYLKLEERKYHSEALLFGNIAANLSTLHKYDSAVYYDTKAVDAMVSAVAEEASIKNQMELAEYQARLAKRYASQADNSNLEKWAAKALEHYPRLRKEHPDSQELISLQAEVLDYVGDAYNEINDVANAIKYQQQRCELLQNSDDFDNLADAYFSTAHAAYGNDYPKAIEYYGKAEQAYLQAKDTSNATISISNQAQAYWGLGNLGKSIEEHKRAIQLAESINELERLGFAWKALASLYQQAGQAQKGQEAFTKALNYYKQIENSAQLLKAYREVAALYEGQKNYPQARRYYSLALQLLRASADAFTEAEILNNIGTTYQSEYNLKDSWDYYQQALTTAKQSKNIKAEAYALVSLGDLHVRNSEFEQAYTTFDEAMSLCSRTNLFSLLGYSQRRKADALSSQGKYEEAQTLLQSSFKHYQEANELGNQITLLRDMAWLEISKGEAETSLSLYDSALQLTKTLNDPEQMAITNSMIADAYIYLGDYAKAKELHETSLNVFQNYKNRWGVAAAYSSLGNLENSFGRYGNALDYYSKADSFYTAIGDAYARTTPINSTGSVYYWQGDYEKSLQYFNEASQILDSLGIKSGFRNTLYINTAEVLLSMGKLEEASRILETALENSKALKDKGNQLSSLSVQGKVEIERQQYDKAIEHLLQAYQINQNMHSKVDLIHIATQLGKVYYFAKDATKASKYLDESIATHEAIGSEKYLWEALYFKGLAAKENGQTAEAQQYLTRAVEVLERIQNKLVGGEEAKKLFAAGAEKVKVYDALINLLISQGQVDEALQYLERSNNQELRNRIRQNDINFKDKGKQEVIRKERSLQSDIDQIDTKITKEKSKAVISSERIQQLEATRSIAEKEYQKFAIEILNDQPELHTHLSVKPTDFKRSKRMIPKGVAMVSYLPGETQLYIFVATSDTLVAKEVRISRKDLFQAIQLVTNFCIHKIEDEAFTAREDLRTEAPALPFQAKESDFNKYGEKLYNALIAPIENEIEGVERIGIVPSGILHFLPFQMVGYTAESGRFVSLVEKHAVFYASSLMILQQMGGEKPELKVLALGNADGTLPATEIEVEEIRKIFPSATVYIGKEATEQLIKASHEDYNVLHFATHGTLDAYDPFKSHLVLSSPDAAVEDGNLTVEEISEFGLYDYELVTLSACQTAVPASETEWPISPATGFLGAGANAVIGSLWKVDDEATGKMMAYFYQNIQQGMEKVDALRAAQIKVSQIKDFEHPHFWAPFVLIGNWR